MTPATISMTSWDPGTGDNLRWNARMPVLTKNSDKVLDLVHMQLSSDLTSVATAMGL